MLKCLDGGPSFFFKMLPVKAMSASYFHKQVCKTLSLIEDTNGNPLCVIADGNRTNQKLFMFFYIVVMLDNIHA